MGPRRWVVEEAATGHDSRASLSLQWGHDDDAVEEAGTPQIGVQR